MGIYICKNCNNEYKSRKQNSKFCSMECKLMYNNIPYKCDCCGKDITIKRYKAEQLISGKRKNCYCSKECANRGLITSKIKTCDNCGKDFMISNCMENTARFCCKKCFEEYRVANAQINKSRICPVCNKIYFSDKKDSKFCSCECATISQQKRIKCNCDYCGKEFERIQSEIIKNEKHYCSNTCRIFANQWSENDKNILRKYYHKIPTNKIIPMLSKKYNMKNINAEAARLGLTHSYKWSDEEVEILKELYPTVPMKTVLEHLTNRTIHSIIGKAHNLNITSYQYNTRYYSDEETKYLQDNYLQMSNVELAEKLKRTPSAIQQRLYILKLQRPFDPTAVCYKNLSNYVRGQIATWRNNIMEQNNYTCQITGKKGNIVIHHCRSFNILMQECIDILDFNIKESFDEYTLDELELFVNTFVDLQEYYGEYICINKDLHMLFHKTYGYGNNTQEQWNKFVTDYNNGKYNKVA